MDGQFKDNYLTMSGIDQTTENTEKITQLDRGINDFLYSTVPNFLLIVNVPQTIRGIKTFVESIIGVGMTSSEGLLTFVCDKYTSIIMDSRTGITIHGQIKVPDNSFSINATRGLEDRLKSISATNNTGIADKSITTEKLADGAITSEKIKAGSIVGANIGLLTIQGMNLVSNTVDNRPLADGCIKPRNLSGIYHIAIPFTPTSLTVNVANNVSFYGSEATPFFTKYSHPTAFQIYAISMLYETSKNANDATVEILMESVRGIQSLAVIQIKNNKDITSGYTILATPIPIASNAAVQILHTYKKPTVVNAVKRVRYILHGTTA
jgi:hypothetical protein